MQYVGKHQKLNWSQAQQNRLQYLSNNGNYQMEFSSASIKLTERRYPHRTNKCDLLLEIP